MPYITILSNHYLNKSSSEDQIFLNILFSKWTKFFKFLPFPSNFMDYLISVSAGSSISSSSILVVLLFFDSILIYPIIDSFKCLSDWTSLPFFPLTMSFCFYFIRLASFTILNITLSLSLNYPISICRILFIVSSLIIY